MTIRKLLLLLVLIPTALILILPPLGPNDLKTYEELEAERQAEDELWLEQFEREMHGPQGSETSEERHTGTARQDRSTVGSAEE